VDPLTHALAGAVVAGAAAGRELGRTALAIGAAAALVPDLDTLIRSTSDPLLYAEYHRHFTHSIFVAPIAAAIVSVPWSRWAEVPGRWAYLAALMGVASHGVLDAATTYGTRLLWPLTDARYGWGWISIIDPIFTLVLLLGVGIALLLGRVRPAALATIVAVGYLFLGAVQNARASAARDELARGRDHVIDAAIAVPTFGNQIVWRSIYLANDTLHVDRIRVPWFGGASWSRGTAVLRFTTETMPPDLLGTARVRRDLERFTHFSNGWLARDPNAPDVIGDARYSIADDRYEPVWGIRFSGGPAGPVTEWIDRSRQRELDPARLWHEIISGGTFQPIDR